MGWWVILIIFVFVLSLSVGTFALQYYGCCPTPGGLPGGYNFQDGRRRRRPGGHACPDPKLEGLSLEAVACLKSFNIVQTGEAADDVEQKGTKEEVECAICQESLADHTATQLPCCHVFHRDCVQKWLLRKASCPTCRQNVTEEALRQQAAQQEGEVPASLKEECCKDQTSTQPQQISCQASTGVQISCQDHSKSEGEEKAAPAGEGELSEVVVKP